MTKEQLIAKAKLRIRKTSSDMLDEDVGQLVEVALADLKRIGVHSSYLDEADIKDPLIIEAVLLYCHANLEARIIRHSYLHPMMQCVPR